MTHSFNLFLLLACLLTVEAQSQTTMQNKSQTTAQGQIIKHGKLVYTELKIEASPEKVWRIFTDFKSYPEWNPFVKSFEGVPVVGKQIQVLLQPPAQKPMTFTPKVLVYDSLHELRWIGKLGVGRVFDGEHVFQLRDNGDGTTTFIQYECFRGILIPFLKKMLNGSTKSGFEAMNAALKKRCEQN